MVPMIKDENGGKKHGGGLNVSNFNEKLIRSWCTLWTPN